MKSEPTVIATDVVILGGGIAGASLAAHLASRLQVVLLEKEEAFGSHTTGRSAAMYLPSYGAAATQPLTAGSRPFLHEPPTGFGGPLISPRAALHLAIGDQQLDHVASRIRKPTWLRPIEAAARVPLLREGKIAQALLEEDAGDIDVDRLHTGFLRQAREDGALLVANAGDVRCKRSGAGWKVEARGVRFSAPIVVNATGAWAAATAFHAEVARPDLTPLRRTVVLVDAPPSPDFAGWPIVKLADDRLYFRPYAGRLLITPADETPSPPCDAQPDHHDMACALARFQMVAHHEVSHIRGRWAGLRTFAPDRAPIIGWSSRSPGFFWLAGLGGVGIQTSPAAGRLAAALLLGDGVPEDLLAAGLDVRAFDPARFAA